MNKFNLGERVWFVSYNRSYGIQLRLCLVTGMSAYLNDVGVRGKVERCIHDFDYKIIPISKDEETGSEYIWEEEEEIISSVKRLFTTKLEALHYLDFQVLKIKEELADDGEGE